MPQGKMKVKAKMPQGAKVKNRAISKPKDIQKRNKPALPKKDLLNSAVTKAINETNEIAFKQKATVDGKPFTIIPSEEVQKAKAGPSSKKEAKKMDPKGRLPKKK